MLSELVTNLKKERKRRVKIRVLPNEGYNIDAELEKNTSMEEVLSTLEELGFKYLSEEKLLQNKKQVENELIKNIYNKFLSITQSHREAIKISKKFYEKWIKMGFDIVDLKDTIRKNIPSIRTSESKSRIITATTNEEQEKDSPYSNAQLLSLHDEEESTIKHSVIISQEGDTTPGDKIRSLTDDVEPITIRALKIEEEVPEIRPIFGVETKDSCKYCSIFKDMGNIVCPNCGRALNLKIGT